MTLIIIISVIVDKRRFDIIWTKKPIKISQKRGKIIYLYKGVNVNFFIMFKILSKL